MDDFCLEHGYEFMVNPKHWGSVPYCRKCDEEAQRKAQATKPKFEQTFCSQCGGAFGPGDSGFSHCDQHVGRESDSVVNRVMRQFESALARKRAYGPPSTH